MIAIDRKPCVCALPECDEEFIPNSSHPLGGGKRQKYCSPLHMRRARDRRRYPHQTRAEQKESRDRYRSTEPGYAMSRATNSELTAIKRGAEADPAFTRKALADILIAAVACNHCGEDMPTLKQRIIDHMVPIVNGGKHEKSNIQILCITCHKIKTVMESSIAWLARAKLKDRELYEVAQY